MYINSQGLSAKRPATSTSWTFKMRSKSLTQLIPPSLENAFFAKFKKQFKILGAIQLTIGLLCLVIEVANLILGTTFEWYESATSYLSPGIWCGIFFIIAGALGVSAAESLSQCNFAGAMVMSIFATLMTLVLLGIELSTTMDEVNNGSNNDKKAQSTYTLAIHGTLSVLAFVELIVALTLSGYGCTVSCCSNRTAVIHIDHGSSLEKGNNNAGFIVDPPQKYTTQVPIPNAVHQAPIIQNIEKTTSDV